MIRTIFVFGHPGGWLANIRADGYQHNVLGTTGRTPHELADKLRNECAQKGTIGPYAEVYRSKGERLVTISFINYQKEGTVLGHEIYDLIRVYLEFMEGEYDA